MEINYEPVGWDTTKYFNPTNMNHMDDGIKAACDKADANEAAISEANSKLGNTDISAIGDGTVTGGLNALNSNLSDVVTIITATLNSLTVAANGYGNMSQDISSFIPNGYKCIGACFVSSGSSWFIPVGVYLSGTSVQVYVRNTYAGQDQGKPIINLICIRN